MYINAQTMQYPYSLEKMRQDNPNVSFPWDVPDALAAAYGVHRVTVAQAPHDPTVERVVPDAMPTLVDGTWVLGHTIEPLPAEEAAERQAREERRQANEAYEPAKLAPALKVLAEKLLTADIAAETLPEQDAQAVTLLFPEWESNGAVYTKPKVVRFNGHLYEVALAHTSQPDWAPDVATTLFRRRYAPTGGIPNWVPWDGHNESLHQVGSEVMHNGLHWRSNTPNNHWEPGTFGWDQVA